MSERAPKNRRKKKRFKPPVIILHECTACDNKWEAKFEVKRCFNCGLDEKVKGSLKAIKRIKIQLKKYGSEWYIPLKKVKIIKR